MPTVSSKDRSRNRVRLPQAIQAMVFLVLVGLSIRYWVAPRLTQSPRTPAVPSAPQRLEDMHLKGSPSAKVGLVVFSDFECPFCKTFTEDVLPPIVREYVDTGKVLLAFSQFPLESVHPSAMKRAILAECASRQGRFWEVHDRLFAGQTEASVDGTSTKSLDREALRACLSSNVEERIRMRIDAAHELGLNSTPTLFVGEIQQDGLHVTDVLTSVPTVGSFSDLLRRRLRNAA